MQEQEQRKKIAAKLGYGAARPVPAEMQAVLQFLLGAAAWHWLRPEEPSVERVVRGLLVKHYEALAAACKEARLIANWEGRPVRVHGLVGSDLVISDYESGWHDVMYALEEAAADRMPSTILKAGQERGQFAVKLDQFVCGAVLDGFSRAYPKSRDVLEHLDVFQEMQDQAVGTVVGMCYWLLGGGHKLWPSPYEPLLTLWQTGFAPIGIHGQEFVVIDRLMKAGEYRESRVASG